MDNLLGRISEITVREQITIGALEKKIGASKGVLSRALQNGTDIQSKWVSLIVENYPKYSAKWLLTGKGNMYDPFNYGEEFVQRINQILKDFGEEYKYNDVLTHALGIDDFTFPQLILGYDLPSEPIDLVKFIHEFPEYDYRWLISGEGNRFKDDELDSLRKIKKRISQNGLAYYSDNSEHKDMPMQNEVFDSILREQILFQNEQLKEKDQQIKEKDAQIKQLLDILQKK